MNRSDEPLHFDARIASWLEDDPHTAPDQALEVVLAAFPSIKQRHAARVPWRAPRMTKALRVGLGVAAVIAAVGGLYVVGPGSPIDSQTPQPSTPASSAPSAQGRIAFVRESGGDTSTDIWVMNPDGSGLTRLTDGGGPEQNPAWSPAASRIAFTVGDAAATLWVMNADGSQPRQLTPSATSGNFAVGRPSWSPDGTRIAFAESYRGEVYIVEADGSGMTRITSSGGDVDPAWSPDGDLIAVANGASIFTVRPDGSDRTLYFRVTGSPPEGGIRDLAWSPDGGLLAARAGGSILQVDARGGSNRFDAAIIDPSSPTWSRDGQSLAVAGEGLSSPYGDIFVVGTDGSGLLNIGPGNSGNSRPSWSSR